MDDDRVSRLAAMLEAAGFTYSEPADCWVHGTEGRGISRDTIKAHDEAWLAAWIARRETIRARSN
jgi:hypothetical protein